MFNKLREIGFVFRSTISTSNSTIDNKTVNNAICNQSTSFISIGISRIHASSSIHVNRYKFHQSFLMP